MAKLGRYLALVVVLLGLFSLVLGIVFVDQSISKSNWIKDRARVEKLTYSLDEEAVAKGGLVDSFDEMKKAADTIGEHRRGIAPSYQDLLGEGRYDPTNPTHLRYAQAMNLENYLYLGVLGFGVTEIVLGVGVFMIVVGIALAGTGALLFVLSRRKAKTASAVPVKV